MRKNDSFFNQTKHIVGLSCYELLALEFPSCFGSLEKHLQSDEGSLEQPDLVTTNESK